MFRVRFSDIGRKPLAFVKTWPTKKSVARILFSATFASHLALIGGAAAAQSNYDLRTLVRSSGGSGLPDIRIDLAKPAEQKYAIVIGNGDYDNIPDLDNTVADAQLVASYLRSINYTVKELINLDKEGFEAALRGVLFEVSPGAEVVVYYAGHGVQIGGNNYIIPVDADLSTVYDLPFESVSLNNVLEIVGSRSRSSVIILDSCRNNPFPDKPSLVGLNSTPMEAKNGFTPLNTPINSLLVFSTSPGAVAFDGEGPNSPFTTALVDVLSSSPEQPVDTLMKRVRQIVYEETFGLQVPWESSSLIEPIILASATLALTPEIAREPKTDDAPVALAADQSDQTDGTATAPHDPLAPISISVKLEPTILIGPQLLEQLNVADTSSVTIQEMPQNGFLELAGTEQTRGLSLVPVAQTALSKFVYRRASDQIAAAEVPDMVVQDSFKLAVNGTERTVQVSMSIDSCDFQAGDYLDPDGVGIARFPNELEPQAALLACQEAVARSPDVGRFHYQLGRAQVALRDRSAAEASFQRALELGHSRALNALGRIEDAKVQETGGSEGTISNGAALAYYAAGVERGDPFAFHSLGRQLLLHGQTESRRQQGFDLLMRSLELGHTFSMNSLGFYFLDEDSDHYDPERGLRFLRESAKRDDIYGFANLGFVAVTGAGGTEVDLDAAFEWFEKAADQGHPTAPSSLGRMYNNGQIGGRNDYKKAVQWYDVGLERGDAWGGANSAWIIANVRPGGYSLSDAAVRAAKAASLKNQDAAAAAFEVLNDLPNSALDAAAQSLMNDLGEQLSVDGAFGAASQAALDRVAAKYGKTIPGDRIGRLTALSTVYWETSKFRVDLY